MRFPVDIQSQPQARAHAIFLAIRRDFAPRLPMRQRPRVRSSVVVAQRVGAHRPDLAVIDDRCAADSLRGPAHIDCEELIAGMSYALYAHMVGYAHINGSRTAPIDSSLNVPSRRPAVCPLRQLVIITVQKAVLALSPACGVTGGCRDWAIMPACALSGADRRVTTATPSFRPLSPYPGLLKRSACR
jgi:hypothetical protein